ncbi:MAG: hypothetical protein Q7S59_04620 [Sulfurimonas sp.]|nr:hypothetical protein [Sulfurimonas sp.]
MNIAVSAFLLDKSYEKLHKISKEKLSGIIFKSRSSSCDIGSAKAYLE